MLAEGGMDVWSIKLGCWSIKMGVLLVVRGVVEILCLSRRQWRLLEGLCHSLACLSTLV